jgi:hypothetical protein
MERQGLTSVGPVGVVGSVSYGQADHPGLAAPPWLSVRMRSPSIVPGFDVDVYLVLDDFGKLGRAYREADEEHSDRETVIRNLKEGQYSNPVRIVCFNTSEGWARDVTEDIAREIQDWAASKGEELSPGLRDFIDWQIDRAKRLSSLSGQS